MDSAHPFFHPAVARAPCGPECRHAERLHRPDDEWVWCHHPHAWRRLTHASTECRWFDPGPRSSAQHEPYKIA